MVTFIYFVHSVLSLEDNPMNAYTEHLDLPLNKHAKDQVSAILIFACSLLNKYLRAKHLVTCVLFSYRKYVIVKNAPWS